MQYASEMPLNGSGHMASRRIHQRRIKLSVNINGGSAARIPMLMQTVGICGSICLAVVDASPVQGPQGTRNPVLSSACCLSLNKLILRCTSYIQPAIRRTVRFVGQSYLDPPHVRFPFGCHVSRASHFLPPPSAIFHDVAHI